MKSFIDWEKDSEYSYWESSSSPLSASEPTSHKKLNVKRYAAWSVVAALTFMAFHWWGIAQMYKVLYGATLPVIGCWLEAKANKSKNP
jgi:hypothetical protein